MRSLAEFERLAADALDPAVLDFVARGAADELTLADNVAAWQRLRLRPRRLVDVSSLSLGVSLLGGELDTPLFVAPTALNALVDPGAERAVARAAADTGVVFCRSGAASQSMADVASAGGRMWSQLYVLRDRGLTREHVAAAASLGYSALVLTVDAPVLGVRDHDARSGVLATAAARGVAAADSALPPSRLAAELDPSVCWDDLASLAASSPLPVIVKGVVRGDDAVRAVEHGAAAVLVSNHGGRQLDGERATAEALTEVVDSISGSVPVLVDGGIRRGTDVVKALALGARAVGVGRPVVSGLAVAGEDGAREVLERLLSELRVALALCGTPSCSSIPSDIVAAASA